MKVIRKLITAKDLIDIKGWTIGKGTLLHVMKDKTLTAPDGKTHNFLIVRVDNGTGMLDLMPETCLKIEL
jgi:1,4-dihydroxy-2-naphthoyl-CoA synthase